MPADAETFQADPMLRVLTDALREGPGTPAWQAAMERLNQLDDSGRDARDSTNEYRRLCRAREHLESGKEFRSIRPGPEFTSRLWSRLDDLQTRGVYRTRGWIALVAFACVIIGCVAAVWLILARGTALERETASLAGMLFSKPVTSFDVTNDSGEWLPMWKPLIAAEREWIAPADTGGGFVFQQPLEAEKPFAVEFRFYIDKPTTDLIPELAVSDIDDFHNPNTSSSHETVVAVEGRQAKVIAADGRLVAQAELPGPGRGEISVRLRISQNAGIVEINGHSIFSGGLALSPAKARYIAVRILRRGPADGRQVALRAVRVLGAQ